LYLILLALFPFAVPSIMLTNGMLRNHSNMQWHICFFNIRYQEMQRDPDVKLTQPINCISVRFLNNLAIKRDVKLHSK